MSKRAIRTEEDFKEFFRAFSQQDWDKVMSYLSDDCVWDASERRMRGLPEIKTYWTGDHASIKESLSEPKNVVFGQNMAYLQVTAVLEFIADGTFFGKTFPKGSKINLPCVDVYTFSDEGTIKECKVYNKFKRD